MYIYKNSNAFPHNKIKIKNAVGERELPVLMINKKKAFHLE